MGTTTFRFERGYKVAKRSTRTKIKYQRDQIDRYWYRIQDSLKMIDELAQGQSEYISGQLPALITIFDICQKGWEAFKKGL